MLMRLLKSRSQAMNDGELLTVPSLSILVKTFDSKVSVFFSHFINTVLITESEPTDIRISQRIINVFSQAWLFVIFIQHFYGWDHFEMTRHRLCHNPIKPLIRLCTHFLVSFCDFRAYSKCRKCQQKLML